MENIEPLPSSTQQQTDVDTLGGRPLQPAMETADSSVGEQLKSIDEQKRIAQLEHEIFTVCKQLDEKSEKFKDVQDQNALLKDRLGTLEQEKLDAARFTESLVKSRDSLIQEKTELQNDRLCLEKRKDELELQVSKLTNEKRRHLDDIDQLRNKSDQLFGERTELQTQIDDFQSEKALIAYDKEQWSREKEILLMSKQWYMNEITDREQKINELRIQLIKEQSEMQRELSLFDERTTELTAKAEQLQENLLEREDELNTVRDQFKKSLNDQTVRVNELEAELRARERLANVYKANNEAASAEIAELTEHELRLQMQLKDAEQIVQTLNNEVEKNAAEHKKVVEEKNAEIKRLSDEVAKSTELLNAGFRLNRADEELIQLSPAAAVASSLLKSGMSLTSIYAEHCRVVGELEKRNDEFKQLERYVTELIEELDSKAPRFQEQRRAYEQICERNECLRLQNDLLSKERQKLQTSADSLNRELIFTKRELERYQREHHLLTIQVQRLLYIIEKGPEALEHNGMNAENASDEYLFSNIRELHAKNIELAEELERLHEGQDKIIANYHNSEIDSLKQAFQQTQEELRLLRENYAKKELLIRELSEQREQYRQLYEQQNVITPSTVTVGGGSNASSAASIDVPQQQMQKRRESLDNLQSELHMWRSKAERLQETLAYVNEDRQTNEKTLNERIDQHLEQISAMRTTIGKLESDLEFQNKNQQLLAKQIDSYTLDLKRSNDALGDTKRQLETLQFKYDTLTNQILEKQQELSTLKVQNYSLNEQHLLIQSREQQSKKELEVLRAARYNNERMTLTLQEVEAVLKRVEAEKSYASESQLQSALLERDNLRQLVDNLHDQNAQLVNGLKANLSQACSDRDKALAEVKSLQSNINALDNVYQRLKSDHEKLREEMEQIQSTDTNVEACKKEIQKLRNTVAYQEKQIAEWDQKCEDLNQTIERKDKQMEDICRLGADMENSIEYGTIERQRMQAVREQLEKDLSTSTKTIEELRNELAGKEMELLNQAKSLSEVVNKMEDQRSKYEQEHMALEKSRHEAQLKVAQFQAEIENLRQELELKTAKCAELSETNLRLITDLAREIGKTEEFERKIGDSNNELSVEREKHQQSLQMLEQEKLRLNDEIKDFITRDEDHVQKQSLYLDEIQKLVQQNSFMERLNQTIASPASSTSLNASFNAGTPNTSRLSLANTSQQQQQSDRMNVIIGYMRTEKQKETELRMNAELELQRIRTQTGIDQHKIAHMETEVAMLRTEAETGARVAVEKAQLLAQLNVLREVQSRYQQLKKTSDEVNQRYAVLEERKRELEQTQLMAQADKRNLEAQLDAATKELNSRTQENKNLLERYNKAMAIASKYSPELVNTLQGDNEKLRSLVAQREKEVELLNKEGERLGDEVKNLNAQLTELKTKGEKLSSELSAVKGFARKFRDERNKLEQEKRELEADLKGKNEELVRLRQLSSSLEAAASAEPLAAVEPRSPVSSTAGGIVPGAIAAGALSAIRAAAVVGDGTTESLRRRLEQATKEKQELVDKVKKLEEDNKNLQRELDEANEKVTRMDMVEKLLKATQKKITDFASDVNRLRAENEQLKQRVVELEEEGQRLQQFEDNEQLKKQLAELEEDAQLMEDNMEQHIGVEEGQPEMPMPNPPMTPEPDQMSPESFGLKLDNLEDDQDVVVEDEEGEEEYGDEEEEYDEDEEEEEAEEEVLNEEEELSHDLGSGEPPLKQRRMHGNASQDEAAGDSAKKDDSGGADGGEDDDDDDEIQLL
uniref:HAMP domain-containing protein n=1 Tax=Globodera rostochiensis TaxID=31243 RepID=A0A914I796_GLORO